MSFSLQADDGRGDPLFVPFRMGRVVSADEEGPFRFVTVAIDEYISFAPETENIIRIQRMAIYRHQLAARYGGHLPYRTYAFLAPRILELELVAGLLERSSKDRTNDVALFARSADYLQVTDVFAEAYFLKFLRLTDDSKPSVPIRPNSHGQFALQGGKNYSIDILHYRPWRLDRRARFRIETDPGAISLVGHPFFDIASPYDRDRVRFATVNPTGNRAVNTAVRIAPTEDPEVQAAQVNLNLAIQPRYDWRSAFATALLASAAATAPALTVMNWSVYERAGLIAGVGIALFLLLRLFGVQVAGALKK